MAFFILAFLAALASSFVSAGPVALDNATLLNNGLQAQTLNSEFENLQVNDPCNTGETACINNDFAACIGGMWQTQACPSNKTCIALPQVRTNGTFVACTSDRNAAAIFAATRAPGRIISGSALRKHKIVHGDFPPDRVDDCGDRGDGSHVPDRSSHSTHGKVNDNNPGSRPRTITTTVTALPPTTTTIRPDQALSLISSILANGLSSPPLPTNGSSSASNAPPKIFLTTRPISSPTPTSFPTPSPSVVPTTTDGGNSS
jgi:hypothetical protein